MTRNCLLRSRPEQAAPGQGLLPESQGPEQIAESEYSALVPVVLVGQGLVQAVRSSEPAPWKLEMQLMSVQLS